MSTIAILFPSARIAERLVAGVPCAARALHSLMQSGAIAAGERCVLMVPGGWQAGPLTRSEIARLTPSLEISIGSTDAVDSDPHMLAMDGLAAVTPSAIDGRQPMATITSSTLFKSEERALAALESASRQIVAATCKPTDGLVSRWINRPVSQFISRRLLRSAWPRPIHATTAAALAGAVMAMLLFLGGDAGLVAGAVLFQLASIIDGVDGELARASLRSSKLGTTLDSANDAATNCAFVAGVSFNLCQRGETMGAQAGLVGLVCLVAGLALLGLQSVKSGSGLNFEVLKHEARATQSPMVRMLGKIISRDVYAMAFALLILAGLVSPAMLGFAALTILWLAVVIVALLFPPQP